VALTTSDSDVRPEIRRYGKASNLGSVWMVGFRLWVLEKRIERDLRDRAEQLFWNRKGPWGSIVVEPI